MTIAFKIEPFYICYFLIIFRNQPTYGAAGPGKYAEIGDIPWQVFIVHQSDKYMCGGSIYDKNTIITAAHCVIHENGINRPAEGIRVYAGGVKQFEGVIRRAVKYVYPPQFKYPAGTYDIALIRLADPLSFSRTIAPIPISPPNLQINNGELCSLSGFGDTTANGHTGDLREVMIKLRDQEDCAYNYRGQWASDIMVCAGGGKLEAGSCRGDSGSSLVCRGYLFGVVVFSPVECNPTNKAGAYTNVAKFNSWILENVQYLEKFYNGKYD